MNQSINANLRSHQTLLRRKPDGRFAPVLKEPTTPEEARVYHQVQLRAEKADHFLEGYREEFAELRDQDNSADDLNSEYGVVAKSESIVRTPLERLKVARVLTFDPESRETISYQNEVHGNLEQNLGLGKYENLEETSSSSFRKAPFALEFERFQVVVDQPARHYHEKQTLRAVEGGLFEYITQESDSLLPADSPQASLEEPQPAVIV